MYSVSESDKYKVCHLDTDLSKGPPLALIDEFTDRQHYQQGRLLYNCFIPLNNGN